MKINNFESENVNGIIKFVAIDDENGTTTIMLKSTYDEMIAQQELAAE
jgi:hypothetical protein